MCAIYATTSNQQHMFTINKFFCDFWTSLTCVTQKYLVDLQRMQLVNLVPLFFLDAFTTASFFFVVVFFKQTE